MSKDKPTKRELWEKAISNIAWQNFCETGQIGAYMFYKEISKGQNNARDSNERNSTPSDRLG